jgi:undecaprenyl-diphosphatase
MFQSLDRDLLLWINSHHNTFLDAIMYWASDRFVWIPLYVFLLVLFIKSKHIKTWLVLICAALLILLCDQSANLFKEYFKQLRPCHEASLINLLHLVNGYCGGTFGYVSSHAANSTGLAVFVLMLHNNKLPWLRYIMVFYVLIICYSRIYLAAHYPSDIMRGIFIGIVFGFLTARSYKVAASKF